MLNQYLLRYSLVLLVSLLSIAALSQNLRIYPVMDSDPKDFGGRVNCIFQDRIGFIWIGKETGLFRYDGNEMRSFRYDPADPQSIGANNILTIVEDTIGNLWIGTKGGGLNYYNRASGRFTRYQHDEHNPESISYNEVYVVKPDGKGNFWIGTDGGGLNFFDPRTGKFQSIKQSPSDPTGLQSNKILRITDAGNGKYWIGTWGGGLHLFDHVARKVTHLGDGTPYAKGNVYCAREVSPGVLWLATWGQGLLAYDIQLNRFSVVIPPSEIPNFRDLQIGPKGEIWAGSSGGLLHFSSPKANYELVSGASASFENVSRVFIDRSNIVWIGCENGTVGKINTQSKQFSTIPSALPFSKSPVSAVWADEASNTVYFTSGNSLVRYNTITRQYQTFQSLYSDIVSIAKMFGGRSLLCASSTGLSIFDTSKGQFAQLIFDPQSPADVLNRQIWTVVSDDSTGFWVGALGVAYQIRFDSDSRWWKVIKVLYTGVDGDLPVSHYPSCFLYDSRQNFWIGTWGGGLSLQNTGKPGFTSFMHDASKPESISDNFAECLSEDSEGHIWAGTHAGLNRIGLRDSSFHCFSVTNGLASDWIAAVIFDQKQRVWVSTQKGISSIAADGKTIRNYDFNDGLPANAFLARSVATDRSGNLYFGSSRGLVWFHPDSIKDNHLMPVPVLVGFKVNDEQLIVSESSPLKQNIELAEEIRLDNEQSTFSIQMAALGYFNPQKNRIKYILKGHDRDWRLAGTDQTASYSGISPGKYTFSMMVSNEDGIWSANEKSLKIVIARSAWLSGWAFLMYFLILSGGIFYYLRKSKVVELSEPDFTKLKRTPNHDIIQPSQVVTEPADFQFLQKALLLVEENIADPNFGVEELCAGMCLSRPQLYRKINAIAGVTVTEFIKEVRLKRAAQLILQKPESISEVAYRVGFNDPKYFSKCFKQQFGVSPAHYPAPNERSLPPQ